MQVSNKTHHEIKNKYETTKIILVQIMWFASNNKGHWMQIWIVKFPWNEFICNPENTHNETNNVLTASSKFALTRMYLCIHVLWDKSNKSVYYYACNFILSFLPLKNFKHEYKTKEISLKCKTIILYQMYVWR